MAPRLAVNREMEILDGFLGKALGVLAPGGRLGVPSDGGQNINLISLVERLWRGKLSDQASVLQGRAPFVDFTYKTLLCCPGSVGIRTRFRRIIK